MAVIWARPYRPIDPWRLRRYASFDAFLDNADELETIPVMAAMIETALAAIKPQPAGQRLKFIVKLLFVAKLIFIAKRLAASRAAKLLFLGAVLVRSQQHK
jgi:hypothetical protein